MSEASLQEKVAHVKAAQQTRGHKCHWPGCNLFVPPAKWGCVNHWFKLPKFLRGAIWGSYRVGQEENPHLVSERYLIIANRVQDWIAAYLKNGGEP